VCAAVSIPVWVMIRPRPGDFVYTRSELAVMLRDIEYLRRLSTAGLVFGALTPEGRANTEGCRRLLDAGWGFPAVFHRAFDCTQNPHEALDTLIELGFRRVLTSGGAGTALDGAAAIAATRKAAAGRIEVLPCGKVRAENIEAILTATGCDQVHGSFTEEVPSAEALGFCGYGFRSRVSREKVAAARAELDRLAGSVSSPP